MDMINVKYWLPTVTVVFLIATYLLYGGIPW